MLVKIPDYRTGKVNIIKKADKPVRKSKPKINYAKVSRELNAPYSTVYDKIACEGLTVEQFKTWYKNAKYVKKQRRKNIYYNGKPVKKICEEKGIIYYRWYHLFRKYGSIEKAFELAEKLPDYDRRKVKNYIYKKGNYYTVVIKRVYCGCSKYYDKAVEIRDKYLKGGKNASTGL